MPEWTGECVKLMHLNSIKVKDLAERIGWGRTYVSEILNGTRNNSKAETVIMAAISEMITEKEAMR